MIPYRGGIRHLLTLFNNRINALKNYLEVFQNKIDVIHIHGTEQQYGSSVLRAAKKIPTIISIQGIMSLYRSEMKKKLSLAYLFWSISSFYEKKEIKKAANFFCRTGWDQAFVLKTNKRANIFLNWETIRPEFFEYRHNFTGRDILFMAGMSFLKAPDICLRTFNIVSKKTNCNLHIIGYCDKKMIETICEQYKLNNINSSNIIVHGKLNAKEICSIYAQCFCLYHPSLIDNSPNSVCEAQVAGLPVVATRVGGVSSLIQDNQTGLLVNKNDIIQHANVLEYLYEDDFLKKYLSVSALKMARKRHDKTEIVDRTISTYEKISLVE
jgi:glycosyltransferase involved in cell wall biosynthesis